MKAGAQMAVATEPKPLSKPNPRPPRPTYNPLPIAIHQLPPLIPHNPLSVLHVAYVCLKQLLFPPSSVPATPYVGYFSSETCSIQVTDEASVVALWRDGFFGKGNLSRSEPTWLAREKRRLGLVATLTAEEVTAKRRVERKAFKQERARKLREEIDSKRKAVDLESGQAAEQNQPRTGVVADVSEPLLRSAAAIEGNEATKQPESLGTQKLQDSTKEGYQLPRDTPASPVAGVQVIDQEHLQLELVEAFFLAYALGVLQVTLPDTGKPMPTSELFTACLAHATFPPQAGDAPAAPDNHFLVSYVAYHHFRSLGWVARSGVKFGVDFLLYNRGPVFAHAEFAVCVLPAYSHAYWKSEEGARVLGKRRATKPWHWLQMVNRVQSQVRKTLVVCYVEVPPPFGPGTWEQLDITGLLGQYRVRDMVVRRWVANRNRD